ncbi:MAG: hypothetical protein MUP47_03765 [Phycisphaerae bacterium]|nr:hypothetical protein [Phycisphaerae bacterium]
MTTPRPSRLIAPMLVMLSTLFAAVVLLIAFLVMPNGRCVGTADQGRASAQSAGGRIADAPVPTPPPSEAFARVRGWQDANRAPVPGDLLTTTVPTSPDPEPIPLESLAVEPDARLLDAIRRQESSGGRYLWGDGGRGLGAYHLSRRFWADGCKALGVDWDYDTCVWDEGYCRQVIRGWWKLYGAATDEQKARRMNGGPAGDYITAAEFVDPGKLARAQARLRATAEHWRKVKAFLEESPTLLRRSGCEGWTLHSLGDGGAP